VRRLPRALLLSLALGCRTRDTAPPHASASAPNAPNAPKVPNAAPAPLGDADFVVGRLKEGLDTAAVRRALGAPDSVSVEDNPYDPGGKLFDWRYHDLTVGVADEGVYGMTLTGPGVATARGLRVGDPADRVRALYGPPAASGDDWEYADPRDQGGMHVVRVVIAGGRVAHIFVGSVLD